jgi:MerR family transcriptional regulator, copper efflux regulator
LNIGEAAKAAGVPAKMIRYYESIGLIPPADRRDSGYRDYSPDDVHRLRFVQRGRKLGFSIDDIRELLRLWSDRERSDAAVRKVALDHVMELEAKAAELQEMIQILRHLADACQQGDRPLCPIINALGGGLAEAPAVPGVMPRRGAKAASRASKPGAAY